MYDLNKISFPNILILPYHDKIDFTANWKNCRSSRVKVRTINVRTRPMSGRIRAAERFAFIPPLTDHHKSATFVHEGWSSERMRERDRERKKREEWLDGGEAELWNNTARTRRGQRGASNAPDLISAFFIFDVTRSEFKWTRYNAVMLSATRAQSLCCLFFVWNTVEILLHSTVVRILRFFSCSFMALCFRLNF